MTNPGSSPDPSKKGFRVTLVQGVIGAASLAGTTAIPLVVQKLLGPTMPSPTPVPTQVSSPLPQATPTLNEAGLINADKADSDRKHIEKEKGKNKGKKNH